LPEEETGERLTEADQSSQAEAIRGSGYRFLPDHEQIGSYALESNETFQDWRFRERVRATLSALNCLDEGSLS
jgi:hypothetical protein